jgi:hypothetical protein
MSSERDEPGTGAAWQGNQLQWDDSYEEVSTFSANAGETPDRIVTPAALEAISRFGLPRRAQQRILDDPEVGATPWQVFLRLGRQALPALIPLLLAGLTFLCILPLSLHHHAYVDGSHLWPLVLLILALAALQGTILYYTDTNEGLWSLAVTGGFALFVVIAAFALVGPMIALLLLILFIVAAFLAIRFYLHKVPEGYVDVTYAFGKYNRTLLPGLNFLLPWEKEVRHLQMREVVWTCDEQTLLFSREDDLHLKATISYQLLPEDAHLVAEQVDKWEEKLHSLLVETLQNVASHLTPDDVLIWSQPVGAFNGLAGNDEMTRREQLNNRLAQQLRDKVALWGVQLNWAQVRDVSLTPHIPPYTFDRDSVTRIPVENGSDTIVRGRKAAVDENATERMAEPPLNTERPAQPVPAPSFSPPSLPSTSVTPIKIPKVETLRQLYDEVRNERITSPALIRDYAAKFEAFARLPDAGKTDLDAGLAAQFLRERADLIERQGSKKALAGSAPRLSDPLSRLPKDENLKAGG